MTPPVRVEQNPVRVEDETWLSAPASTDGRMIPDVTAESEAFWKGFGSNQLIMMRCDVCTRYTYYPVGGCVNCGSDQLTATEIDSRGTVYSFTVCYLEYGAGMQVPYVAAHIELSVQDGLRMIANIVNCKISEVFIGMPVQMIVVDGTQPLPFFEPIKT
jgi:uncharacterized OB-fold protein